MRFQCTDYYFLEVKFLYKLKKFCLEQFTSKNYIAENI